MKYWIRVFVIICMGCLMLSGCGKDDGNSPSRRQECPPTGPGNPAAVNHHAGMANWAVKKALWRAWSFLQDAPYLGSWHSDGVSSHSTGEPATLQAEHESRLSVA